MKGQELLYLILFSPLLAFFVNAFVGKRWPCLWAGATSAFFNFISFACVLGLSFHLLLDPQTPSLKLNLFNWIHVSSLQVSMSFVLDRLSVLLALLITGVGFLIQIFSIGYMVADKSPSRYFAYLSLFVFNMLILVLGDNLLLMFVGWEGVGLCSYLLIGYWFQDKAKAAAGMKAFITNRVGDAALLLGMFLLFYQFGSLQFDAINASAQSLNSAGAGVGAGTGAGTSWAWGWLACLLLFVGAMGKSAQIPLHVWLPDAMAGPTPVSALIHAATMVTAGVYLLVRLSPLYVLYPLVLGFIGTIGALTAFLAASVGMTQWDIKKVLAYSTLSQLGYMFLAVGVGAFDTAIFHLLTHGFFKALLFLGAGSIIHALHEEQDMRKMGGLSKYMPLTYGTFLIGWLSIIGLPPFAGFFSKDEILWKALTGPLGHFALWLLGFLGAIMTAFYMTRLMALTFWRKPQVQYKKTPHESPKVITIPLIALAILALLSGIMNIPHAIGIWLPGHPIPWLSTWLKSSIGSFMGGGHAHATESKLLMEYGLMALSIGFVLLSSYCAYFFYIRQPSLPKRMSDKWKPIYQFIYHKYKVDELYDKCLIRPLIKGSLFLWFYVDVLFIDKITYLLADFAKTLGQFIRWLQNGNTQQYATYIALATVASCLILLYF